MRTYLYTASVFLGLALVAAPVQHGAQAQESDLENVFNSIGSFVIKGLGPARTLDDVEREERQRREREQKQADDRVDTAKQPPAVPPPVTVETTRLPPPPPPASKSQGQHGKGHAVESEPLILKADPEPAPLDFVPTIAVPSPSPEPKPRVAPPLVKPVPAAPSPVLPAIAPPVARPKVVAPATPVVYPPMPELTGPPSSRIAATATVDQALKLGGPGDLYGRRGK